MTWLNPGCSEPRAPVAECILSVLLCVACVSVWSWSALQFALLRDLKIALANPPSVHPLFVLYCIVYYKSVCVCVCVCVCVVAFIMCVSDQEWGSQALVCVRGASLRLPLVSLRLVARSVPSPGLWYRISAVQYGAGHTPNPTRFPVGMPTGHLQLLCVLQWPEPLILMGKRRYSTDHFVYGPSAPSQDHESAGCVCVCVCVRACVRACVHAYVRRLMLWPALMVPRSTSLCSQLTWQVGGLRYWSMWILCGGLPSVKGAGGFTSVAGELTISLLGAPMVRNQGLPTG